MEETVKSLQIGHILSTSEGKQFMLNVKFIKLSHISHSKILCCLYSIWPANEVLLKILISVASKLRLFHLEGRIR